MLQGSTSYSCHTDTQNSMKCLRTCCGPDCNNVANSLVSLFCNDDCIRQYVKRCTELQVCCSYHLLLEHCSVAVFSIGGDIESDCKLGIYRFQPWLLQVRRLAIYGKCGSSKIFLADFWQVTVCVFVRLRVCSNWLLYRHLCYLSQSYMFLVTVQCLAIIGYNITIKCYLSQSYIILVTVQRLSVTV